MGEDDDDEHTNEIEFRRRSEKNCWRFQQIL